MGGTLTLWPGRQCLSQYAIFDRWKRQALDPWSSARCWVLRDRAALLVELVETSMRTDLWTLLCSSLLEHGRYRPYFENYTVDASILDSNSNVRIT